MGQDRPRASADETDATPRVTYDRIASHFAATREHAWPEVVEFVSKWGSAGVDRALDLGCGNGRHAELLVSHADRVVGVDVSRGMLLEATSRARRESFDGSFDPVQADASRLPLRDACVDLAVYVATLHHLPTRSARIASLDELDRVLVPDRRALVSVWSTVHDRFEATSGFDASIDWTLPDGETVARFYHIYDPSEFEADLAASDLRVDASFVSSGNCYAVVRAGE